MSGRSHLQAAFSMICENKGVSKVAIAEKLGVSVVTAGKIASELLAVGAAVRYSDKNSHAGRPAMLLYPNRNLHSFVYDTASNNIYYSSISSKPRLIGNCSLSFASDGMALLEALSTALSFAETYKYKKYCIGFYIVSGSKELAGSSFANDDLAVSSLSYDELLITKPTQGERRLCIHIASDDIAFSFSDGNVIVHKSIGETRLRGKTILSYISSGAPNTESVISACDTIMMLSSIFSPTRIIVSQSAGDDNLLSEMIEHELRSVSEEVSRIAEFPNELHLAELASLHALDEYTKSL